MAENYLSDAKSIFTEAKAARRRKLHHRAIRLSQESFELSVKAILRLVGVEYPKEHEVSDAMRDSATKFPHWFQSLVADFEEASVWLSERRAPAMYGDEVAGKPASQLFNNRDSRKALTFAGEALRSCERLLKEAIGKSHLRRA